MGLDSWMNAYIDYAKRQAEALEGIKVTIEKIAAAIPPPDTDHE